MKLQGKTYKAVLAIVTLACLLATFFNQRSMNTFRRDHHLTHTKQIDNLPPTLAFTTVVLSRIDFRVTPPAGPEVALKAE